MCHTAFYFIAVILFLSALHKFWSALATAPAEASAVAKVAIIINKILSLIH